MAFKFKTEITVRNLTFILLMSCLLWACQNNSSSSEKSIEEVKADSKISSIIRNPVTANEPLDTINVAKITFENDNYNFGEVDEGAIVEHTFKFTNTGKVPLIITNARSTCGCTVPEWPKEPVEPGATGEIHVQFNTKNKKNEQVKPVTITANTYPSATKIFVNGFVNPKPEEDSE
jgi:hypothetical protein